MSSADSIERLLERPSALLRRPRGTVIDLFCGAGGLSHGFRLEGYHVAAGLDLDEGCRFAFEENNQAPFLRRDVDTLEARELDGLFYRHEPRILVGCAPCQPFSSIGRGEDDPKWRLVSKFADLIVATRPDIVSMENVPRLLDFQGGSVFREFVERLKAAGYHVHYRVVFLPDYGLPQKRSRLVLLASLHGEIDLEPGACTPDSYATVEQAIGDLPPIAAGERHPDDPLHTSCNLTDINLRRIRASKPGGTWDDWDTDLVTQCHRVPTGKGYRAVYGRMRPDAPAPTITTQFHTFGSGRFGHPVQDRALSLREGAILQSFPRGYAFVPPGGKIEFTRLGRMIGNAVPVLLGRAIARSIRQHMEEVDVD